LREGDLVFFVTSGGTVSHVGISMGGTAFIHASTGSKRVRVDDLTNPYFAAHYRGARRLLR
ncbi:MAG: C40 family peptidase, partial [Gammaproteobacteria bacterium]